MNPRRLTLGQMTRRAGCTARALRLYEGQGLIRAARTAGGHRLFDPEELERLRYVLSLREAGWSLEAIAELLGLRARVSAALAGAAEPERGTPASQDAAGSAPPLASENPAREPLLARPPALSPPPSDRAGAPAEPGSARARDRPPALVVSVPRPALGELRERVHGELAALERKIAALTQLQADLAATAAVLETCAACDDARGAPRHCEACERVPEPAVAPRTFQLAWRSAR